MRVMDIKTYLSSLDSESRDALAKELDTSLGHLRNVSYGYRPCAPEMATALERRSHGLVTRAECRPDDYWLIWPDLPHPTTAEPAEKVA